MRLFLDSSALAKRYVQESGTNRILSHLSEASEVGLSSIAVVELLSAFNRLRREGKLGPRDYKALKKELATDIKEASVITVNDLNITKAVHALEVGVLRTLDAIQIGAAQTFRPDLFLTSDKRQYETALLLKLSAALIT
jgi:predicted nucleic acid-binding protein